jgi:DNA-binding response OmpR family regulator
VLLDLALPDTDGYEVARALRSEHGDAITIIAVTGFPRDSVRLDDAGFDAHILKPIDPAKLPARIASIARRKQREGA